MSSLQYCKTEILLHSAGIAQKQLGGRAPKAVESRHARYMWRREGTLLDPTVGGSGAPLLQNFRLLISEKRNLLM